ncbi:MAG: hypothetical protein NWR97_11920 [Salibacteraceae bacterium]|nr:hypothetical protein [Salibacteraceae bacterium]
MRVALVGSKLLSVAMLNELIAQNHEVLAVYTRDDEAGMKIWHQQLGHPSLKEEAQHHEIAVYEGINVNSSKSLALLQSLNLDIIFSCFWSEIFREPLLNIPRYGVFNLHTALLPNNQGSRPLPWAIIKGEPFAGITLHKMMTGVDNGPIVDQKAVEITKDETAKSLYEKITTAGIQLFKECLPKFENNTFQLKLQPTNKATYQPRGEPYGGQLNPYWDNYKQTQFKSAFNFPPFRSYRNYPRKNGLFSVKVILTKEMDKEVMDAMQLPNLSDCVIDGIGNSFLRKQLKSDFELIKESLILKNLKLDAHRMYPVHDILLQKKTEGVSFTEISINEISILESSQPFRYKNGLLEIPHIKITSQSEFTEALNNAEKASTQTEYNVFLHLMIGEKSSMPNEFISEELKRFDAEKVTFQQVCQLFDTDYETFSS